MGISLYLYLYTGQPVPEETLIHPIHHGAHPKRKITAEVTEFNEDGGG